MVNFREEALTPWPEHPAPSGLDVAALAAAVAAKPRLIWSEGSAQARVGIVLDNPGLREDAQGRPFVCGTRRTLRRALHDAGIAECDVQAFFLFKLRPRARYDREAAVRVFLPLLEEQLQASAARVLIGLGNTVAHALCGGLEDVKALRGRWHCFAGLPLRIGYHPLAARRRPALFPTLVEDLAAMRRLAEGNDHALAEMSGDTGDQP